MQGVAAVGWICDGDGRRLDDVKVAKIVEWPTPTSVFDVRSFMGLAVYFRIVIQDFAVTAAPMYQLLKSGSNFEWHPEHQEAFIKIKETLSTFPCVLPIDYSSVPLDVVIAVDASLKGWGAVLMQVRDGVRKPARYESGTWSATEQQYDAGKRECQGVLKALKKFRHWVYGVHFTLEIDAKTLVSQLNRSATDLPGALVTSWIAWIRLFDFEVRHVPGQLHGAADGLSRRPHTEEELADQEEEEDVDDFILAEISTLAVMLNPVGVSLAPTQETISSVEQDQHNNNDDREPRILGPEYSEESEEIARWCVTFRRPTGMPIRRYNQFKRNATNFVVQGEHLFHRGKGNNMPLRRVLDSPAIRGRVIIAGHDELGHKGREATYSLLKIRYWWEGMYTQIAEYVRCCPSCQFREPNRLEEPMAPNRVQHVWDVVFIDTAHLPNENGYSGMAQAREGLSGWLEAVPLKGKPTGRMLVDWIWSDVICRYGFPTSIVMDKGPEFRGEIQRMLESKGIKRVAISPYNPGSNGAIERSMRTFKDALSKMTFGYSAENASASTTIENLGSNDPSRTASSFRHGRARRTAVTTPPSWRESFYAVLLAYRMTVNATTGMTPYRFLFGKDAILPVEMEVPTWSTLPWETVTTREDLISLRARQILQRDEDVQEAIHRFARMRDNNKSYHDGRKRLRAIPLEEGSLVLLHDTQRQDDKTSEQKLRYRWSGPYRVRRVLGNGAYTLEELDGTPIFHKFSSGEGARHSAVNGDRLKRFWLYRDTMVRQESFPPKNVPFDQDSDDEDDGTEDDAHSDCESLFPREGV
ncbi:hypothetical protein VN97_g11726 [Penicillium thymicola]|uniref:Integrase catalytic domain-containing protein n=1 Tax=Penicillium thymicola TaxID=293382 RepID=A0AAI9X2S1_PENTH|nr:hypothetical protein VN97_g11726 [Penicillium thymicola]